MGKLHEILSVESDLKTTAEKLLQEAVDTFSKKDQHFLSLHKEYKADKEDELSLPEESKPMVETVTKKLDYVAASQSKYFDCVLQKEIANTVAKSDLVLEDGTILAKGLPATFLLGLENKFKRIRALYEAIPTLSPGDEWQKDTTTGNYRVREERIRTKKVMKNHLVSPATEKHPAQVNVFQEDERVGVVTTVKESSMLSPKEKSDLIGRVDSIVQAAKKARMRANSVDVPVESIGKGLFEYINRI